MLRHQSIVTTVVVLTVLLSSLVEHAQFAALDEHEIRATQVNAKPLALMNVANAPMHVKDGVKEFLVGLNAQDKIDLMHSAVPEVDDDEEEENDEGVDGDADGDGEPDDEGYDNYPAYDGEGEGEGDEGEGDDGDEGDEGDEGDDGAGR